MNKSDVKQGVRASLNRLGHGIRVKYNLSLIRLNRPNASCGLCLLILLLVELGVFVVVVLGYEASTRLLAMRKLWAISGHGIPCPEKI